MSLRSKTFSLSLCAILLVVGTSIAWQGYRAIAHAKARHAKLVTAARLAGIPTDEDATGASLRSSKRERTHPTVDMDLLLADLQIAVKGPAVNAREQTPEEMVRLSNFLDRCSRLSPQQMEVFLASIRALRDLSDEDRSNMVHMALLAFSKTQPAYAIKMASLDPDPESRDFNEIVTNAFGVWAKEDLLGAVEWAKANLHKLDDDNRFRLFQETVDQDPALGLPLISDFQLRDPSYRLSILLALSKPEGSQAILTGARQYLAQLPDETSREIANKWLFKCIAAHGLITRPDYETHRKWLESSHLTLPEFEIYSTQVAATQSIENPSQWIDWIGSKLPPEKSAAPIQTMVKNWTQADYQAAGKCLTTTPDGPTKNAAIRAYAETVAKADPATAKQWALTLPPGPEREETLQRLEKTK
jgi:hypothetical protein